MYVSSQQSPSGLLTNVGRGTDAISAWYFAGGTKRS
jgi:hypothetical protein